jgi:8-oxo-dGTP pyrophosphatase MutT (NUDIX family)
MQSDSALKERIRSSLHPPGDWAEVSLDAWRRINGDHALNPDALPPTQKFKRAAVLVPIIDRPEGLSMLLTRRTAHLKSHAGQVAFPGGREEPGDPDAVACALRETEEEVGLQRRFVEVVGMLDAYVTVTAYAVTPVVGLVTPGFELTPDAGEVDEVFEVPLSFLLDPANHQKGSRTWNGTVRHFFAMPYQGHYIWGATAGMLLDLYRKVKAA